MWAPRHLSQAWTLPKPDREQAWYAAVFLLVILAVLSLRLRPHPTPIAVGTVAEVAETIPEPPPQAPQTLNIQQILHEEPITPPKIPHQITIRRKETLSDGRLLVVAKVTDENGEPVPDQVVEWSVHDEGIGEIVDVRRGKETNEREERVSVLLGSSRTALDPALDPALDTPTTDPNGMPVEVGESWCLIRADTAGESRLLALAPGIVPTGAREAELRHTWMTLKPIFPRSGQAIMGSKVVLATRLIGLSDDKPISGYRIRYILDEGGGVYLPSGVASMDVVTDATGAALLSLEQSEAKEGTTRIRAQILGNQIRTTANPAILAETEIEIAWLDPGFVIEAKPKSPVRYDDAATVELSVTAQGEKTSPGFKLFGRLPPDLQTNMPRNRDEVDFGDPALLTAGESTIAFSLDKPGSRRVRFELRDGERIRAVKEVDFVFAAPELQIETRPAKIWKVGMPGTYELRIMNSGVVPADHVRITDELPLHFDVAPQESALRFSDRMEWEIDRLDVGESKVLQVAAVATKPVREVSLRTRADSKGLLAGETTRTFTAEGLAALSVSVRDIADPVKLTGEVEYYIVIENKGTAAAQEIRLAGSLPEEIEVTGVEGPVKTQLTGLEVSLGPIEELSPGQSVWCRLRAKATRVGEARIAIRLDHEAAGKSGIECQESTIIYEAKSQP